MFSFVKSFLRKSRSVNRTVAPLQIEQPTLWKVATRPTSVHGDREHDHPLGGEGGGMVTFVHMPVWPRICVMNRCKSMAGFRDVQLPFHEPPGTGNGLPDHVKIPGDVRLCP